MNIHTLLGMTILAGFLSVQGVTASPAPWAIDSSYGVSLTEAQKVERLIDFIRGLDGATFIRNGSEHNCQEAADHLQAKWKKHMDKIRTAENFVTELASESGMTGEVYKIKFPDGTVVPTKQVLLKELKRLEQQ